MEERRMCVCVHECVWARVYVCERECVCVRVRESVCVCSRCTQLKFFSGTSKHINTNTHTHSLSHTYTQDCALGLAWLWFCPWLPTTLCSVKLYPVNMTTVAPRWRH